VESAIESSVLDFDAAVHHNFETLRLAVASGLFVVDTQLNPHDGLPDLENLVDDAGDVAALAEDIDDVGNFGK
jgi:hypothetical protein